MPGHRAGSRSSRRSAPRRGAPHWPPRSRPSRSARSWEASSRSPALRSSGRESSATRAGRRSARWPASRSPGQSLRRAASASFRRSAARSPSPGGARCRSRLLPARTASCSGSVSPRSCSRSHSGDSSSRCSCWGIPSSGSRSASPSGRAVPCRWQLWRHSRPAAAAGGCRCDGVSARLAASHPPGGSSRARGRRRRVAGGRRVGGRARPRRDRSVRGSRRARLGRRRRCLPAIRVPPGDTAHHLGALVSPLPGGDPAVGGSLLAWREGSLVRIVRLADFAPVLDVSLPGADALAVSDRWLAYRARGPGALDRIVVRSLAPGDSSEPSRPPDRRGHSAARPWTATCSPTTSPASGGAAWSPYGCRPAGSRWFERAGSVS